MLNLSIKSKENKYTYYLASRPLLQVLKNGKKYINTVISHSCKVTIAVKLIILWHEK